MDVAFEQDDQGQWYGGGSRDPAFAIETKQYHRKTITRPPVYSSAEKCVDKYGLVGRPGLNSGLLFSDQRQQQHCKKLDQHLYQLSTEQQEARPAIHKTRPHPHRRIGDSSIRQNSLTFDGDKTID
jgi:hypothetical protein